MKKFFIANSIISILFSSTLLASSSLSYKFSKNIVSNGGAQLSSSSYKTSLNTAQSVVSNKLLSTMYNASSGYWSLMPPSIAVDNTSLSITDNLQIAPFSTLALSDNSANLTLQITLSDSSLGILIGDNLTNNADGIYILSADSAAQLESYLQNLLFVPTVNLYEVGVSKNLIFELIADDTVSKSSIKNIELNITSINDVPAITNTPQTYINEDSYYSFTPTVIDQDINQTVTFTITNKPAWASFNTTTGILSGTPTNDNVGTTEDIIISVEDNFGAKFSLTPFNLEVVNTDDLPTLATITNVNIDEDSSDLQIVLDGYDIDGDTVTYTAKSSDTSIATAKIVDGVLVVSLINQANGTVTIEVYATANGQTVKQTFDLTIEKVNDLPSIDTVFKDISIASEIVSSLNFEINVSDIDGDDLNLTVESNNTNIVKVNQNWTNFLLQGDYSGIPLDFNLSIIDKKTGTANILVTLTDAKSQPVSTDFDITLFDTSKTLSILKGWNMLSLPTDTTIGYSEISSHLMNALTVWKYSNGWKAYGKDDIQNILDSAQIDKIVSITKGEGFWVNSSNPDTLKVSGESYSIVSLSHLTSASSGWYLLGSGVTVPLDSIIDANSNILSVWVYDGEWKAYGIGDMADTLSDAGIADLNEVKAGQGFWINVK